MFDISARVLQNFRRNLRTVSLSALRLLPVAMYVRGPIISIWTDILEHLEGMEPA